MFKNNKTKIIGLIIGVFIGFTSFEVIYDLSEEPIELPEAKKVERIEFEHIEGGVLKMVVKPDDDKIAALLNEIGQKATKKKRESVSDEPVGADYIIFNCYLKDHEKLEFYLYKEQDEALIEQPYLGIWKIPKVVFQRVKENRDEIVVGSER